jgi:hypothetical protein
MAVLSVSIVDPSTTFDKKSSEAAYLENVLRLVGLQMRNLEGNSSAPQNVLGMSASGVANTVVATFTHSTAAAKP